MNENMHPRRKHYTKINVNFGIIVIIPNLTYAIPSLYPDRNENMPGKIQKLTAAMLVHVWFNVKWGII